MSCHQNIGRSVIHRLDPRLKIVAALVWSFLLALSATRDAALAGLAGSAVLALAAFHRVGQGHADLARLATAQAVQAVDQGAGAGCG